MEELDSCCAALLHLFCYLYVFNVGYSPEVTPAFLFIQHAILGVVDDLSMKNVPLKMFLKQLEKVVTSSDDISKNKSWHIQMYEMFFFGS